MNDTYKLRSVGGALMVTIPQHAVRVLGLSKGDEVTIVVTKTGTMRIERVKPTTKGKPKC